jgi:glycosyltransferase involved in cell wall biosynthesis
VNSMLSICAVIAVRNEAQYLRILLPLLASQGIDVVIVDNESTDSSQQLFSEYDKKPILRVERLAFRGFFSLREQLEAKQKVFASLKHDWVIHHDADEVMENNMPGLTLRDAIQEAHDNGYNALNFDEFVFLPPPESNFFNKNYYENILRYYFFEPYTNRLNRAWKRTSNLNNVAMAGHKLTGPDIYVFPVNHILRHYIVLGYEHAKQKYLSRTFSAEEVSREWHKKRLSVDQENLKLPTANSQLFMLDDWDSKRFQRNYPTSKHYWEWR